MELETAIHITHHVSFAHRLKDNKDDCRNLHGHTWIIVAKILGKVQKTTGMIVDFGALKKAVKEHLDSQYDHASVLQEGDIYIPLIQSDGGRLLVLREPPTTEILAAHMLITIQHILDTKFTDLKIIKLKLQETPSNKVTVKVK